MNNQRQVVKKKKRVLTAGVYIGILGNFIGDKETLIEDELNKIKNFAKENGVTIIKEYIYIDRDDSRIERYKFDTDNTDKKFQLRFMFIEC